MSRLRTALVVASVVVGVFFLWAVNGGVQKWRKFQEYIGFWEETFSGYYEEKETCFGYEVPPNYDDEESFLFAFAARQVMEVDAGWIVAADLEEIPVIIYVCPPGFFIETEIIFEGIGNLIL